LVLITHVHHDARFKKRKIRAVVSKVKNKLHKTYAIASLFSERRW